MVDFLHSYGLQDQFDIIIYVKAGFWYILNSNCHVLIVFVKSR
jgi:hypothetical protein